MPPKPSLPQAGQALLPQPLLMGLPLTSAPNLVASAGLTEMCPDLPKLDGHSTLGVIYHCLQTTWQGSLLTYVQLCSLARPPASFPRAALQSVHPSL